jgi:hypothetical protein
MMKEAITWQKQKETCIVLHCTYINASLMTIGSYKLNENYNCLKQMYFYSDMGITYDLRL